MFACRSTWALASISDIVIMTNRRASAFAGLALAMVAPRAGFAQQPTRWTLDVAAGGGNVGGGAFSTEAKFVGSVTVSAQRGAPAASWRPFGALSVERHFGNEGPGYCAKHEALGQCIPRPPAVLGGVAVGGVQWLPLHWLALSVSGGGGVFRSEGSAAATSPSVQLRGEVLVRPEHHVALGFRGEQGQLTDLLGAHVTLQSLTLFLRVR